MQAERPPPLFKQFLSFLTCALPQADGFVPLSVYASQQLTQKQETPGHDFALSLNKSSAAQDGMVSPV